MKKSLIALAFGTLGLGIAEFVMMGILPDVAKALHVSVPKAGNFISAYALGVCVGAPALILARRYSLKKILLVLIAIVMAGNLCAALSPNYGIMLFARLFRDCLMEHILEWVPLLQKSWPIMVKVRKLFPLWWRE